MPDSVSDGLADYVPVVDRLADYRTQHPRCRVVETDAELVAHSDTKGWLVTVEVYENAEDPAPSGRASSFLAIPGRTAFTRNSELENASTSATGRALVYAGSSARHVASRDEVAARSDDELVPAAWAKGTLMAALQGNRHRASLLWAASWPDSPTEVPRVELDALCRAAAALVEVEATEGTDYEAPEGQHQPPPAPPDPREGIARAREAAAR
jgi:hypothetical protein